MKQLIQNFKTGELYVDEVPIPALTEGHVLVATEYSLISAGTERGTVKVAQSNLISKARQRPDLVAQVIQNVKKEGLKATIGKVKTKLDSLKALGYSASGIVIASMDHHGMLKPGDRVACAGQDYASHAEVISVPQNLVVKVPEEVNFRDAATATMGAIAMQGVRQAQVQLGEKVCVIGLGLLGQITCQLLKSAGCNVLGIDLKKILIDIAAKHSADVALHRNDPNLEQACDQFTRGRNFDSVIITAAAPTNDPFVLAGKLARKKGKVVLVGLVPMNIPRDPDYYRKELDVHMSCSYGPGRYDVNYEQNGNDYPFAYVRWTEQRNMESFLDLLASNSVRLGALITHIFEIDQAEEAYDIILGKTETDHLGLMLRYSPNSKKMESFVKTSKSPLGTSIAGFIGAGSFAQSYLIPNVKKNDMSLAGVVTSRGITAKNVADKFGFNFCSTDPSDILMRNSIDSVFIATPHTTHADLVIKSMKEQKNIFVEKPLATDPEQLRSIIKMRKNYQGTLMVGFNRRFAPVSQKIKDEFKNLNQPFNINIRINAGFIPKESWIQQKNLGAGRIIGEMCHFIDLMQYFTGSDPMRVFAECIHTSNEQVTLEDNISIVIKFRDGSVGSLNYLANGDSSMPKELIEVFCGDKVGVINDFRSGCIHKNGRKIKLKSVGKGHSQEISAFCEVVKDGGESPIDFRSLCHTTLTTFKIQDSLATGLPQSVDLDAFMMSNVKTGSNGITTSTNGSTPN